MIMGSALAAGLAAAVLKPAAAIQAILPMFAEPQHSYVKIEGCHGSHNSRERVIWSLQV
jgi:hypothetical protein